MDNKEKITTTLQCNHCSNIAPMERVAEYTQSKEYEDDGFGLSWTAGVSYELYVCPSCEKVTLRSYHFHDLRDPEDWIFNTLYPLPDKIPIGLPQHIKESYETAIRAKKIDANAYGVLLGRVLEMICQDRNAKGKNLQTKLENLHKKGEIPNSIVEISHNLRQLRNVGAHADLGSLTDEEVPILNDLCRAVLEYVYSAPELIQNAKMKYDAIKKKSKP